MTLTEKLSFVCQIDRFAPALLRVTVHFSVCCNI